MSKTPFYYPVRRGFLLFTNSNAQCHAWMIAIVEVCKVRIEKSRSVLSCNKFTHINHQPISGAAKGLIVFIKISIEKEQIF